MGFLRKIGRKVKKGVKKLFSTKLGRIAGSIGLYLVMGAAAKSLSGWAQSTFGQAAAQTGTQVATETAVQAGTDVVSREVAGKAIESGITNAATNSEAANIAFNAIETGVKEGTTDLIMKPNLTDAVSDVGTQLLDSVDTKTLLETGREASRTLTDIPFSELDVGQKIQKVGVETKDYFAKRLPEDYIEDTTASLATGAIVSSLSPEPEEPFISAGVAPRPQTQPAQSAYIADVGQQYMAANNTTRLPDFNQIMQQNMYGTGTPQYFQQLYQPEMLPLPQV
tara:strand:+ start:197 stop:1039 length:843 start_codon:yes stop_codon:yes gene_type:complete